MAAAHATYIQTFNNSGFCETAGGREGPADGKRNHESHEPDMMTTVLESRW